MNGKVYIGQTINSVNTRFKRHLSDAVNHIIDTHLTRAINKYGPQYFTVETIDTASTADELSEREKYWIQYYDSVHNGYNTARGGYACGGNTYYGIEDLTEIRKKLSESKRGGKNPHSRAVLVNNLKTGKQMTFSSMQEAADYLHLSSHMPVSRRCRNPNLCPLFGIYKFEYCENEGVTTIENQTASE